MKTRDNFQNIGQTRHRQAFPALPEPSKPPAAYSPQPTVGGLRAAFTLIEVLVAMTVLSIMVLMAANIFQSSSAAWNIGTQKADMNTAARAALDYMVRELAGAVAGPIEAANPPAPISFEVFAGNDLLFRSLVGDVNNGRALRNGAFYHNNNQLMYAHQLANPYDPSTPPSHSGAGMLITNVLSIQFYVYTNETDLLSGNYINTYPKTLTKLPICVDIALEMLSNDDMRRYNQLSGGDQTDFSDRNSKVYSTRVYFPNRNGYSAR